MFNIDWDFIATLEGKGILKGYVPSEKNETKNLVVSGVTCATGFDLGQHDVDDLDMFQFSKPLKAKLLPYMLIKGAQAKAILKAKPLVLTEKECEEIDRKVKENKALDVVADWRKYSKVDFYSLSKAQQTVIMSVAFQYGDLPTRTPNFWRVVTSGDWPKAVKHLENFGDAYGTRRKKEANYLRKGL